MSLKLKPFLTAALLVAAGVGPARASKRPPKGVWPLFPALLLAILVFAGCQSGYSRASNDALRPGETIWVCNAKHVVMTESIEARILSDGTVTLPLIGAVRLAGLTIPEAERTVEDAYRESGIYTQLQVRILREQADRCQGETKGTDPVKEQLEKYGDKPEC